MQWEVISFHGLIELESGFVIREKSEGRVPGRGSSVAFWVYAIMAEEVKF